MAPIVLESDQKPRYRRLGRRRFRGRLVWNSHPADARRDRANPLFPINPTHARLRHDLARLRRRTWCVSQTRDRLQAHRAIAPRWANDCRGITNRTRTAPAPALGVTRRPYRAEEVLPWRQDGRRLSPPRG